MEQSDEQSKIRRYLLNGASEAERAALDERLLTDDVFFEEITIAEENLFQDYADGNLADAERESFKKSFLTCEKNRRRVKFARALRQYVDEQEDSARAGIKPGFFDSLKAWFAAPVPAAAIAVLIIGAVAVFFIWKSNSEESEVLVALNKFQKNSRPVEARITGFDYAPKIEGSRGTHAAQSLDFQMAKSRATAAVLEDPNAANHHALGRVFLAEKDFEKSVEQFEKAARLAPRDAKIRNDLGVALMEKANLQAEGSLANFGKANEELANAIALDRNLLEAYFNKALCLQNMPGAPQAREAWQEYLKRDSTSEWAKEAQRNLENLASQKPVSKQNEEILRDFLAAHGSGDRERAWQTLSRNREIITGKLIPQQLAFLFVDAKSEGRGPEARDYLNALLFAGALEQEKGGDPFWRETAEFYAALRDDKIPFLKKAQDAIKNAYRLALDANYEGARQEFEKARRVYAEIGDLRQEKLCAYWLGYVFNRLKNIPKSVETLQIVEDYNTSKNYKWLSAHTLCWLAINESEAGKTSKALEFYERALAQAEAVSDTYNSQKILSLIADEYKSLKRNDAALKYLEKSLELEKLPEASQRQKWRDYEAVTKTFYTMRYYQTALVYGHELLSLAFVNNENSFKCDSYSTLGAVYSALKKYDEAIDLTQKGLETAQALNSDEEKAVESANAHLHLGKLEILRGHADQALIHYDRAASFFEASDYQGGRYEAHKGKLFCYLAEKRDAEFQSQLPKVLELFENNRKSILEEQNRNTFFENEQDVYDIAINYEFAKANFVRAFDYSEKSRSRSLLDLRTSAVRITKDKTQPEIRFSPTVFTPLNLTEIQAEMPENVQLLEYSVLSDRVLIWLITKDSLKTAQVEIAAEKLNETVSKYLALVSKNIDFDEQRELATELYRILISPIEDQLDENREICIVPDKFLFRLPFAALFSGKYLIEKYAIFYAPSANVFLICSKKAEKLKAPTSEILLAVGDPAFDQTLYKNLPRLPSAEKETLDIRNLYDDASIVFTKADATKSRIMENLSKADVIHFAGHYLVNESSPLLSGLLLAESGEDSNLANYEILGEKLARARLIVLSACRTSLEKYYDGEGMIGISRAFLATDVPLVVASQWEVDSEASAKLMIAFHRHRKLDRSSTVKALQRAQIEMLRDEKFQKTYYWSPFAAVGGYAEF